MKIINLATIDWDKPLEVGNTSYYGFTITTKVVDLREKLGPPAEEINDGEDKVNFEWHLKLEDGTTFTVYDWKNYREISENETIEFHVGHSKPEDINKILDALNEALK